MRITDEANVNWKNKKDDTLNTMAPLMGPLKLFALNYNSNVEISKANPSKYIILKSVLTAFFLGVLTFYSLYFKINNVYGSIVLSIKLIDAVQMIYDYCQYIVDLYFVYKYGRHIISLYLKHYEYIDQILNLNDYSNVKRTLQKLLGLFSLFWVISSACDFAAWVLTYGWIVPIVYSISYIFIFIKMLTVLNLTCHVMHVTARLRNFRDILKKCYFSVDTSPEIVTDCLKNRDWLYSGCTRTLPTAPRPFNELKQEVKTITKCYLLLTEQVAFINNMHGFRILLNSLSLLIDMVRFTNLAIRIISGSQQLPHPHKLAYEYFPAASSLMRLFTCVAMLIVLVENCENTYRQREEIINIIDHLLINKNLDDSLQEAVSELRNWMQERPICFTMANVFDINYSLLVSTASVVVTYTIILLQSKN